MRKSNKDNVLSRVQLVTVLSQELVKDFCTDDSKQYNFDLFGSMSVYTKPDKTGWEKVIQLPELIVKTVDNVVTYYLFNGVVLPTNSGIQSYRELYDEISNTTGREIKDVLYKKYIRDKRR